MLERSSSEPSGDESLWDHKKFMRLTHKELEDLIGLGVLQGLLFVPIGPQVPLSDQNELSALLTLLALFSRP